MKTLRLLLLLLCGFSAFSLSAQLNFKIQLMPDGTKWGIYVVTQSGTNPTVNTITGSGQITMVAPLNFAIVDFNPVSGFWANNAVIDGPAENPTKSYISFGLMNDNPQIIYSATAPTLLFTFRKANNYCPDELYLIENGIDPFDQLPNSENSNPGNEITVLDFGYTTPTIYNYGENVAPFAWDCHDCDGDGIPNALEDTNGNGVYDPNIDVSDLCNGGGGGGCVAITGAALQCEGGGTACGDNPPGQISLTIDISGGEAPFSIKYTDGTSVYSLQDYQSVAPFQVDANNGAIYSLLSVTGNDGCEAEFTDLSGEVPVTFPSALQFVTQPTSNTVCNSEGTVLTACATATNATFSFSWQYSSDNGATWQPVPMGTVFNQTNTGTMSNGCDNLIIGAAIGLHGYRFRAVASGNGVPTVYSQVATLELWGPLHVTEQPQSISTCSGENAVFTATISNDGIGPISYQWQTSSDGGLNWSNVSGNSNISGNTSPTMTIANTAGLTNKQYRLRAQIYACNEVLTQPAQLNVEGPVEILAVISPVTVCRGEDACFEVQAALLGDGQLSYQWQERPSGSATWTNVAGASAPIFCLSNTEGRNGYCYRALVRTASCSAVTSVEACLVVEDKAFFAQQPQNTTICAGETATLTASAAIDTDYAGQVSYRWQTSADGGQSWQDLDNDGNFAGAQDATLTITDAAALGNLRYRLGAMTGICEATYSDAATVTVEGPVIISEQPVGMTVCPGSGASFSAATSVLGAGNLQIHWQTSSNGNVWNDLADGGNYAGTQTGTLTVQNAVANRLFRISASTGNCAAIFSEPASLAVDAPILFSLQPESATVCPDEAASFSIAVGGGSGALSLQWQSSPTGQIWTDIAEGSNFTGTQTSTMTVADAAGLDGTQFRLVAASQNCTAYSASAVLTLEDDAVCNPTPAYNDCVSLAVKKLDGNIGWSVWVITDSSFTETPYQLPTSGKVTLVTPVGFVIQGVTSFNGGKWKPGKVIFNPAQDPGKIYFEYNLTPNQNFLELTPNSERLLFSFSVVGGCPESLSLIDNIVPPGFSQNQFTGFGAGNGPDVPFRFCGNAPQDAWVCPPTSNMMAPTGGNGVATGQQLDLDPSAVLEDFGKTENVETKPASFFGVAPNPAREVLTVAFDKTILDKTASLRLWNLQGQVLQQAVIEGEASRRFDLGNTIPGIYFLTLEVDGKLVQREKIIVQ